ncbi:MAG: NADH-quinone oxidoreductase subunit N [Candidatus Aminicenantes bacterium]|nr:NADH-quinone oxidoreductase subunit N [Candidatus Aminicenantes bacterium]
MNSIMAAVPLLTVVVGSLFLLILEVFLNRENKSYLGYISLTFLVICGIICTSFWNKDYSYFNGSLHLDNLSIFFYIISLLTIGFVILISLKYLFLQEANHGEFFALILFALSGMMIMVSSTDLLIIFLGLELLSISSYILAGFRLKDVRSSESAIKYFLLGSFASAFLVFGMAFLFGISHSTSLLAIVQHLQSGTSFKLIGFMGLGLVLAGFGFKIALAPFHMWAPDVYEGAPTPVTTFFSIGPKAAGFAVFLRFFHIYWHSLESSQAIFWLLWVIAVLTMIIGNLAALRQTNIKRILAYSSIAHGGYLMVAVLAQDYTSLMFYLVVYLFMNIGAFSAVIALSKKNKEFLELDDYSGIGFQYPWIGALFSVFLFSLAGFPPTGGFLAKFYVFSAAVRQGLVPLVIISVLTCLVSVFYYLRIIVYMYMKEPFHTVDVYKENPALFLVMFLCVYEVFQLGINPGSILVLIRQALISLPVF